MSIACDDPTFSLALDDADYAGAWAYAQADSAFLQVRRCWDQPEHASVWLGGWSQEVFKYFRGPSFNVNCSAIGDRGCAPQSCAGGIQAAGYVWPKSLSFVAAVEV